jgi:hypothetical protein
MSDITTLIGIVNEKRRKQIMKDYGSNSTILMLIVFLNRALCAATILADLDTSMHLSFKATIPTLLSGSILQMPAPS